MSIPTMKKDLAVIQKLSDLPNATEGLTADQLKAKFDEAVLALQSWINETLVPAITAANIPFTPDTALDADNVAAAIREVQSQMTEVSSGAIANGSVTAEKLANSLLERVYGGRSWVSMDTPGSGDNAAAGFPVGQVWLRPEFTVSNDAGSSWSGSGCTVATGTNRITVTGNNTVATVTATQILGDLGLSGDRVYVLFDVENKNSDISALTVSLNGGAAQDAAAGVWEGNLSGGALTVKVTATWPSTSLAGGSFDLVNYTVVNVDQAARQAGTAKDMGDWGTYLRGLLPLSSYTSPAQAWMEVTDGNWWPMGYEVLPVDRGGTGESSLRAGAMLYGGGDRLEQLEPPTESGSFLQWVGGLPKWQTAAEAASGGSLLRVMTGSYSGTGANRTVSLPVEPKLLNISSPGGGKVGSASIGTCVIDHPVTVGQGGKDIAIYSVSVSGGTTSASGTVQLSGSTVTINSPYLCNQIGVTYNWVAVY